MDALYQAQILAFARAARQDRVIAQPSYQVTSRNPLCGDEVVVSVLVDDDIVRQAHVAVKGCALCEAGAGLLVKQAAGQSLSELYRMGQDLSAFLKDDDQQSPLFDAFTPVKGVKNRHKCVTLAFQSIADLI